MPPLYSYWFILILSTLFFSDARPSQNPPIRLVEGKSLHPLQPHKRVHDNTSLNVPVRDNGRKMYSQEEIAQWDKGDREIRKRDLSWDLQIAYEGDSFFEGWDWFTESDPSHGLVNYVDWQTAFNDGLAFFTSDGVPGIQVDHWSKIPVNTSRDSVRISTRALFAGGLFVIDMALMPWGCGVWPAFWTLGYEGSWPSTGEIDIIEGIQSNTNNQMTIHTLSGCSTNQSAGLYTGKAAGADCDSSHGGSGCSIFSPSNTSYGEGFNDAGGGVFAMLWNGSGIRIWSWNRADIPSDLTTESPLPDTWGLPAAAWDSSTCDVGYYFQAQVLILNIDLCGDWAGNLYSLYSYCPLTCGEYIADPKNLNNTVMLVNSIKVYQQSGTVYTTEQAANSGNLTGVGGAVGKTSRAPVMRSSWFTRWRNTPTPAQGLELGKQGEIMLLPALVVAVWSVGMLMAIDLYVGVGILIQG